MRPTAQLLIDHHKNEQLGVDFIFKNGHVLLVFASLNIKFISIMNMQGRGANESENDLKKTIPAFTARKINIDTIVGDNEFEVLGK